MAVPPEAARSVAKGGAGDGIWTRDPCLGKAMLYHWATPALKGVITAKSTHKKTICQLLIHVFFSKEIKRAARETCHLKNNICIAKKQGFLRFLLLVTVFAPPFKHHL